MTIEHEVVMTQNHPIYWFEDGSLILDVEIQRFKVHHTIVSRHSRLLPALIKDGIPAPKLNEGEPPREIASLSPDSGALKHVVIDPRREVKAEDVEALLQHLYHDIPLANDSSFAHVTSILRVSSPQQLDYPRLHELARTVFESRFPTNPNAFTHTHPLHEALPIATAFNITSVRKAILYSLVTRTEFDVSGEPTSRVDPQENSASVGLEGDHTLNIGHVPMDNGIAAVAQLAPTQSDLPGPVLSTDDAKICMNLMMRLIDHFTPILFTPAATPHMECTDVFAETWMSVVIQPAIDDDGVYKPLETLQRMKEVDWAKYGLCASCVVEKRAEWESEQSAVWELMDRWLDA